MNSSQVNEDKDFFPVDLIEISKNLAKEKGIDSEEILLAMETAIAKAGRTKYGQEFDIRAQVDRQSGKIGLYRYMEIVDSLEAQPEEERINKIDLKKALLKKPEAKIGEFIIDQLPQIDFGRIAVQTAKQVIFQKVKKKPKGLSNFIILKIELER